MNFQLVLNDQQDKDIIRWLNNHPKGQRTAAVREVLRRSIQQEQVTLADIYHAIMELKRNGVAINPETNPEPQSEDPELVSNLDRLLEL